MASPQALAENIQKLLDERHHVDSAYQLAKRAGLSQSSIGRILKVETAAQIDTLDSIAAVFRLRACDLLDPTLKSRVGTDASLRISEPRPPVVADEQWRALSPTARALIEDIVQRATAGALPDATASWLQQSMRMAAQAGNPGDRAPQLTATGQAVFDHAAKEAEQHHAQQQPASGGRKDLRAS